MSSVARRYAWHWRRHLLGFAIHLPHGGGRLPYFNSSHFNDHCWREIHIQSIATDALLKLMEFINEGTAFDELLQAQTHVWNHTFNFINSMSLKCAVQLGIPDIIHSHAKPMTLSELVAALPIHSSKAHYVYRLMRILVHSGFFSLQQVGDNHEQEGYSLTQTSRLLLKDSPLSARPLILTVLDPILTKPWHCLSTWFQNDDPTPFNVAHGETFWEYASHDPRFSHCFDEAMAADSSLLSGVVISKCKWAFEGLKTLVDVGGGTGNMAKAIAETFPDLECTVFDLPRVVANLQGTENLKYVGGDMFESVPPADAILLKWVLHDWNNEDCVKILKKCKEAIISKGKGGKVIIIDMVMENQNYDEESTETQLFYDMEALVAVIGQERNEKEWAKLFFDAGFSNYKISPTLGIRALIEVYP